MCQTFIGISEGKRGSLETWGRSRCPLSKLITANGLSHTSGPIQNTKTVTFITVANFVIIVIVSTRNCFKWKDATDLSN